jgi:50S ribosomal protein L16 3-hydroxylase
LDRAGLFALAGRDEVEARLVTRDGVHWTLRPGPLPRRVLPPLSRPNWTVLVQGLDLHVQAAHELLARFRFVPDARLDDLMLSYASDGGGVGPHLDSYDVFLLQVGGRRRWRIGRCDRPALRDGVPLKMLTRFDAEQDWLLEPGDMLYLPPDWAHEGTAVGGDCMTASIGFRAPTAGELAQALFARLAEVEPVDDRRYRDPRQGATREPASLPRPLLSYADREIRRAIRKPGAIERALGEWLTEPKPHVWFETQPGAAWPRKGALVLDRRSRMAYDERQVFINGESYRATGRDARVARTLADARRIDVQAASRLSETARSLMLDWLKAGWMHVTGDADEH